MGKKLLASKPNINTGMLTGSASWLAILGAAFAWSWMDNGMFNDLAASFGATGSNAEAIVGKGFGLTIFSSIIALALMVVIGGARRPPAAPFYPRALLASCGAGAVGSILVILACLFGMPALYTAGSLAVGACLAIATTLWGLVCIAQGPQKALIHISGAWAIGFFLNTLMESLQPLAKAAMFASLPVLAGAAYIALIRLQDHSLFTIAEPQKRTAPAPRYRSVYGADVRFPLLTLVFCLAFGFMYSTEVLPAIAQGGATAIVVIGVRGLTAAVLLLIGLSPLAKHVGTAFNLCLSLMVAGALAMTVQVFTNSSPVLAIALVPLGYAGFDILTWTLISHYSAAPGSRPICIASLTMLAQQVGILAGGALGSPAVASPSSGIAFVAFMYVFIMGAFGLTRLCSVAWGQRKVNPPVETVTGVGANTASKTPRTGVADRTAADDEAPLNEEHEPSPDYTDRIGSDFGLTSREVETLSLFSEGRSAPFIAEKLVLSESTVRTHIRHIYAKCGVHNRQELLDLVAHYRRH